MENAFETRLNPTATWVLLKPATVLQIKHAPCHKINIDILELFV